MQVEQELIEKQLTVKAIGRLDTLTSIEYHTQITESIDEYDITTLILDFSEINYISSSGLRVLLELQKKMNTKGNMKIIHVQPDVFEVLKMTNFTSILTIEQ